MQSHKNLIYGFISIMILTTLLGITAIYTMFQMSNLTEQMYKYPFSISKAILHIQVEVANIKYHMQKLESQKNPQNREKFLKYMNKHKRVALQNYKLIFNRYHGDKEELNESFLLLIAYTKLNEQIFQAQKNGNIKQILTMHKKMKIKLWRLEKLLEKIEAFANNQATSYYNDAHISKVQYLIMLIGLFILIGVISSIIAFNIIQNSIRKTNEIKKHFLLIEQNVNIATCSLDTSLIDVTHSLARLFHSTKSVLLSKKTNPFLGAKQVQIDEICNTVESLKNYKGEIELTRDDSTTLWIEVDIQPILNSQLKLTSYSMIINDITDKKELEVVSITDGMTELYNRREFDRSFKERLNIAKRERQLLNFMMLDIDYFKLYNDNYGHQCGDVALKSVALSLKNSFTRANDGVYRLGGEEFGVLFTTNTKEDAIKMILKVLKNIESLKIPHKYSKVNEYLTISIGLGMIKEYQLSDTEIYIQVDNTLYKAKNAGRNRYEAISI